MKFIITLLALIATLPASAQIVPSENEVIETVASVYDGDTFTIARTIEPYGLTLKVRLIGIDTPEIRGAKCAEEKRAGIAARDHLRLLIRDAGNQVILRGQKSKLSWDRNGGRIDARVIIWRDGREQDAADIMINDGFGVAYSGAKARVGGWCKSRKEKANK